MEKQDCGFQSFTRGVGTNRTICSAFGFNKTRLYHKASYNKEVVVQGNPRVYKALRNNLADVLTELQRIENGGEVNDELLDLIKMIADILGGLKEVSE